MSRAILRRNLWLLLFGVVTLTVASAWLTRPLSAAEDHAPNLKTLLVSPRAPYTVNTTDDHDDGSCAPAPGDCTLREAVIAANTIPGADTINVPAGIYTLTLTGAGENAAATGDLDLTDDLTISGAGPKTTIVDGNRADRVFDILLPAHVKISGLSIRNGNAGGDGSGGGVRNASALTLDHVWVRHNKVPNHGGGIYSDINSRLIVRHAKIVGNTTGYGGGGIGTESSTYLKLRNSLIKENKSLVGGGLWSRGSAALTHVTITRNQSDDGGGIHNGGDELMLTDVTISNNSARGIGGGMNNQFKAILINVTISGNTATSNGGGLYSYYLTPMTNVTIAYNSASQGGGGIYNSYSYPLPLTNTIVANNFTGGNCLGAAIISHGHNLSSDDSCASSFTDPTDHNHRDPLLGELQNNGGATKTHALKPGSPAIDAGDNSACPSTDQRGGTRPIDGNADGTATCDIGAFEFGALKPSAPKLISPQNGTSFSQSQVPLDWKDTVDAFTYLVQVRQDSPSGTVVDKKGKLTVSQYTTQPLPANHTYYWRVRACNGLGCSYSPYRSFIRTP